VPNRRQNDEHSSSVPCLKSSSLGTISRMATRVLLCPPDYFDVIDQKNPYMSANSTIDREKAKRQWEGLKSALERAGCEVETIDPVPELEDMVFAANQVFVGCHQRAGRFIVPSSMVYASRQREVSFYVDWFLQRGYKVIDIGFAGGDHLEGHGDLLWHPGCTRVYAGYGFRSTRGGVEKFRDAMSKLEIPVVPLRLIDPFCYHLDTCLCPLNDEAVLIFPGAYDPESLAVLRGFWKRVYELTADEAHKFVGNGIVCNGHYLAPYLTPHLESILAEERLTPIVLDTSEFEKSGGSLFCMKTFLP
jgi:N-dimethylarginine dimethylaminohydrolase